MKSISLLLTATIAISTSQISLVSANVAKHPNILSSVISRKVDSKLVLQDRSPQIGYITAAHKQPLVGVDNFWRVGSKNTNQIIFSEDKNSAWINIDGQDVLLTYLNRQRNGDLVYKSDKFQVRRRFVDVTTAKDRKGYAYRMRGTIVISNTSGWKKKIEVECLSDGGG